MIYSILGQTEKERELVSAIRLANQTRARREITGVHNLGGAMVAQAREVASEVESRRSRLLGIGAGIREGQRIAASIFPNLQQWRDACARLERDQELMNVRERIEREEMEKQSRRRMQNRIEQITRTFTEALEA